MPRFPRSVLWLALLVLAFTPFVSSEEAPALPKLATGKVLKPMITGLKNPESVAVGSDGRIYITEIGEFGKDGDGRVLVVKDGKAVPFTTGLDDPKGLVAWRGSLYTTDKTRVLRIDKNGKAKVLA